VFVTGKQVLGVSDISKKTSQNNWNAKNRTIQNKTGLRLVATMI
jgi:hypothetical protein